MAAGLVDDPDEMLGLLAGATDQHMRDATRRLSAQLFLDLARRGPSTRRGISKIIEQSCEEAFWLANECNARIATVSGPSQIVDSLAAVLER